MRRVEASRQEAHDSEPTTPRLGTKFIQGRNRTPRLVFMQRKRRSRKLTERSKVNG